MAAGDGHKIKRLLGNGAGGAELGESYELAASGSVTTPKYDARSNHRANPVLRWTYENTHGVTTGLTITQIYFITVMDNDGIEADIQLTNEDEVPDVPANTPGLSSDETKVFGWNTPLSVLTRKTAWVITNTDVTNPALLDMWVDN